MSFLVVLLFWSGHMMNRGPANQSWPRADRRDRLACHPRGSGLALSIPVTLTYPHTLRRGRCCQSIWRLRVLTWEWVRLVKRNVLHIPSMSDEKTRSVSLLSISVMQIPGWWWSGTWTINTLVFFSSLKGWCFNLLWLGFHSQGPSLRYMQSMFISKELMKLSVREGGVYACGWGGWVAHGFTVRPVCIQTTKTNKAMWIFRVCLDVQCHEVEVYWPNL